ncbi:MAG: hypothetical protein RID09_23720 [Coleofasciculus sp. G1-WW12-02]
MPIYKLLETLLMPIGMISFVYYTLAEKKWCIRSKKLPTYSQPAAPPQV